MMKYKNIKLNKPLILRENKEKCGIYIFINNNNDAYVGRSTALRRRLLYYYNNNYLKKAGNSHICRALLLYGIDNFNLIIEYSDRNNLAEREQYYIDNLKPKYNILKKVSFNITPSGYITYIFNIKNYSIIRYKSMCEADRAIKIGYPIIRKFTNTYVLVKDTFFIFSIK